MAATATKKWALVVLAIAATSLTPIGGGDPPAGAMAPTVWYVDADAVGAETGANWTDAFADFDDAVASASGGDEIWVSEGEYVDPADLTFEVDVYGGFDGLATPTFADRDPSTHVVFLRGGIRLGGTVTPPGTEIVIDGVTFSAIEADGINVYALNHTVVSLTEANIVGGAFGLVAQESNIDLIDVSISGVSTGWAIETTTGSDVRGRNVSLNSNLGGARANGLAFIRLVNSSVVANATGISAQGTVEIVGSDISGNGTGLSASVGSAGATPAVITIDRTTLSNNQGTGIRLGDSVAGTITNSIVDSSIGPEIEVISDLGTDAGSVHLQGMTVVNSFLVGSDEIVDPGGVLTFSNSIIDLGTPPTSSLSSHISYSLVRGSSGSGASWSFGNANDGGNNIDRDPDFVVGTDYELGPFSPAIDVGLAVPIGGSDKDVDGDDRTVDSRRDMGAQEGDRARITFLAESCLAYDSSAATGVLAGVLDGDEVRTIDLTGPLAGQGGAASCLPAAAVAAVVSLQVTPQSAGNLRLSEAGVVPTGGVVNYAPNGLANTNTVTVPLSPDGEVDVAANGGSVGAGLPSAGVRIRVLGYYDGESDLVYVPGVPCAAHDSRASQGGMGGWAGPFGNGGGPDAIDLSDPIPSDQGGTSGTCNIGPTFYLVNLVAVSSSGGSGFLTVESGPNPAPGVAFADIGMDNAAVVLRVPASASISVHGDPSVSTETRAVLLGHYGFLNQTSGADYTPINPCAAFDSRTIQGASGSFAGPFDGAETVTYSITGDALPAGQGGLNGGSCGVPTGASGVLVNLVATNAVAKGNLQVYATGTTPTGGVLNFAALSPSMNNSNSVPVQLSADGRLSVTVNGGPQGAGLPSTNVRGVILGYFD